MSVKERHARLIDSLAAALFPFQESEEEQEAFTPVGRRRVDAWIDQVLAASAPSRAKAAAQTNDWKQKADAAEKAFTVLRRALRAMGEVLARVGKHPATCPRGVGLGYYVPPADAKCTCGLSDALELARREGERGFSHDDPLREGARG